MPQIPLPLPPREVPIHVCWVAAVSEPKQDGLPEQEGWPVGSCPDKELGDNRLTSIQLDRGQGRLNFVSRLCRWRRYLMFRWVNNPSIPVGG
jgi:hypothetical protein